MALTRYPRTFLKGWLPFIYTRQRNGTGSWNPGLKMTFVCPICTLVRIITKCSFYQSCFVCCTVIRICVTLSKGRHDGIEFWTGICSDVSTQACWARITDVTAISVTDAPSKTPKPGYCDVKNTDLAQNHQTAILLERSGGMSIPIYVYQLYIRLYWHKSLWKDLFHIHCYNHMQNYQEYSYTLHEDKHRSTLHTHLGLHIHYLFMVTT